MRQMIVIISFFMSTAILAEQELPQPKSHLKKKDELPDPSPQNITEGSYGRAVLLMQKKDWGEATIILKRIVDQDPADFKSVDALARTLTFLRRREEALALLNRTQIKFPNPKWVERIRVVSRMFLRSDNFQRYQNALELMQLDKKTKALDRLKIVQQSEPHNVVVLLRLAQCQIKEGQADVAWEYLETAKKLNPFEPEIALWLGRALSIRGEQEKALKELRFALANLKNSELAPVWIAEAISSMGKKAEALKFLKDHLNQHPLHILALLKQADIQTSGRKNSEEVLWEARISLQLAVSRMKDYEKVNAGQENRFESELGFQLETVAEIKKKVQNRLLAVERRINQAKRQ